jgi:beta-glucosidase
MGFPEGFVWGAAGAAYQVEGAARVDGRGPSIWDVFCRRPGAVWLGQTGDVTCDHYHRYKEDVSLMKSIGLRAYRLSVAWPRVIPEGCGAPNEAGLDFYDRLIDELLSAGIVPYVTLFHWDYPHELRCRGGWLNQDSSDWFADYAKLVASRLSDRVGDWITLNEPQTFIGHGLKEGRHAPGDKLSVQEVLRAGHNVLLAHGKGVMAIRARSKVPCRIGYAPVGCMALPASLDPKDVAAARLATFSLSTSVWNSAWWMDPVYLGHYPEAGPSVFGRDMPIPAAGDMATIHQPLDFLGINVYSAGRVRSGANGSPEPVPYGPGHPHTMSRWAVAPEVCYWGPKFFAERYGLPIVLTENGMASSDWVALDGKVHDEQRIDFLKRYLRELQRATDEGVDVRGYFHWSFTDNFEWSEGYRDRFGLVHVDFATQKRVIKESGHWYARVIAGNGKALGEDE